ncbi:hypothetical protein [Bacillus andreraoultii]|uniref:hypothetical protein n=1 Tax=Bacillus andreraoultii TaxID=1499685 RepID=UPI00053BA99A|nr:hypothetical protein [Bacillus andreraoultii]
MKYEEFQQMDLIERVEIVNNLLTETQDLREASKRLGLNYSSFCKEMRVGGFVFNQSKKQYEKTFSIREYKSIQRHINQSEDNSDVMLFITEHFDELKELLRIHSDQLVLNPMVYDPSIDSVSKTFQINSLIYQDFSDLCSTKFAHLRNRDIVSQCLYEFTKRYKEQPPIE